MKHSTDRNNYNWYLGDRKIMGIYIGYIVLVVATFIGIAAFSKFLNLSLFLKFDPETNQIIPSTVSLFEACLTSYFITSYISGIAFIVWLLIKIKYQFRLWHIFLISIISSAVSLTGIINLVGAIVMLPSIGYSFYRIIKGGKK